jgi:phosphoribosyl-ATP pyrophosphohydrolase
MPESPSLGAALDGVAATIAERAATADPSASYTAALLAAGAGRCARKFGEEATETIVAALSGSADDLAQEAADTLYHLLVLLAARGVPTEAVAAALTARAARSGHQEKAARGAPAGVSAVPPSETS